MRRIAQMLHAARHLHWPLLALGAAALLGARDAGAVLGAELIRNVPERYGRFEARLRFAPGDGIVSSMFLWKPGSEIDGAFWNEIDIEKVGASCDGYSSNAIVGNPAQDSPRPVEAGIDLCAGYHTHALEWAPDRLLWSLDGVEQRRLDADTLAAFESGAPEGMQIRFNLWVGDARFGGTFASASLPAHQYLAWVSYARYTPGAGPGGSDFTPAWREEFDAPLGAGWSLGTWASPFGHSTHSPANVTLVDGVLVLSLTEDAAPGFSGVPPADDGAGGASAAGAGGPGNPGGVGGGGAASGEAAPEARPRSNASCGVGSARPGAAGGLLAALGALALGCGVRRARRRS